MEPIVAQNAPLAVQPAGAVQATELAHLLRDGRVLAGEVLQSLANGSVLIGIGRQRVPAQTHLRMDPGHHFLFQVELVGGQILLRILGGAGPGDSDFWRYLRDLVGEDRPIGELLGDLAQRVRGELERPGEGLDSLRRLLANLEAHVQRPSGSGSELQTLLMRSGLRYEAALLSAALRGFDTALLAELGNDLKGQLLRSLADLPDGPLKEAVARALAGIEAEQLLNLARGHSGEPLVLSFPLPDVEGWTTAHLLVPPRQEDDEGDEDFETADEETLRIVLGVNFSRTGPVRADVMLTEEALTVRLLVTRPGLAERIQRDTQELVQRLGDGSRLVRVVAARGTLEEVNVGARPLDISLFRDHRIMDVSG